MCSFKTLCQPTHPWLYICTTSLREGSSAALARTWPDQYQYYHATSCCLQYLLTSHHHIKNLRSSTAIRPLIVDLLHEPANTRKVQLWMFSLWRVEWLSSGYVSGCAAAAPWGNYTQGSHLSRMLWTASITFNTNILFLNINKIIIFTFSFLSQLFIINICFDRCGLKFFRLFSSFLPREIFRPKFIIYYYIFHFY